MAASKNRLQADEESPPDQKPNRPARLSVNLGAGPAEALRELMESKDITATEAIRRAISVWSFIEKEQAAGRNIAVVDHSGGKQNVREIFFQ
jgi:hypothetical protein